MRAQTCCRKHSARPACVRFFDSIRLSGASKEGNRVSAREPKSTISTTIQIIGRTSERKGRLEFTSGNVSFFRKGVETPSIKLSYQQLSDLLMREVEYRAIDPKGKLPKGGKDDFWFQTSEFEYGEERGVQFGRCPLSHMDSRRIDEGTYTLFHLNADRRATKKGWYASISLPMVISILNWYVDKFLAGSRKGLTKNKDVVITKPELRRLLLQLLKKLD